MYTFSPNVENGEAAKREDRGEAITISKHDKMER